MQALRQYSIPIKGLDNAIHPYSFSVLSDFFNHFEDSPITEGNLKSFLELEKKSDHIILLFNTEGVIKTECDRCTAMIDFPLSVEDFKIIIKYDENERDEGEIVYIHPDSHELNVGKFIYDQIVLSIPIIKVFDCDALSPKPCNEKVLSILENKQEETSGNNLLVDALKNLNIKAK